MHRYHRLVRLTCAALTTLATVGSAPGNSRSTGARSIEELRAIVPFDVIASGFGEPSAVAVSAAGDVLVADRAAGTLTRIDPFGGRDILLRDLRAPAGIAVAADGETYVVEAGGGRVLRSDASGATAVVVSGLRQPGPIAVGPDGRMWLAFRKPGGSEYSVAMLSGSGALVTVASGLMNVEAIAADRAGVYVAMARLAAEHGHARTTVARVPLRADGSVGPIEPLLARVLAHTLGVAVDASGDLFISGTTGDEDAETGVIVKRHAGAEMTDLAAAMNTPVALAFAPNRDLVAVEKEGGRRVIRFRAPAPPVLQVPAFTNRNPLLITGRAGQGDRVDALVFARGGDPAARAVANASTGEFALEVPLTSNASTALTFTATSAGGSGLVSPEITVQTLHDDRNPDVTIAQPLPGVHVRGAIGMRANAHDEGSGTASIAFMLDDGIVSTIVNDDPPAPFSAAAPIDTLRAAEGVHALTAMATDRAGNAAAVSQLIMVDRTPPDTVIASRPPAETAERTAAFEVGGVDVLSPVLEYSWRLDEGAWSPFSSTTSIALNDLAPGDHRFEVRARDLAGNEDPTPAAQVFTVRPLRIRILEPAEGAVVAAGSVWIRGTVEGVGGEVTVTVPLPPGLALSAWPAAVEAGTFAAEVPVDPATSSVTVVATDFVTGATASSTIGLAVQPVSVASTGRLVALPSAGLSPHVVNFTVNLPAGTQVAMDLESDGNRDFEGDTIAGLSFLYQQPGVYVPTLTAMTSDGQVVVYRTIVEVYDRATLDARVQAVWNGFRQALAAGNVARAVAFIHGIRRARWQDYYSQLSPEERAVQAGALTTIELIQVGRGGAEYEMVREEGGGLFSYPIVFVADADGRWRLWQF